MVCLEHGRGRLKVEVEINLTQMSLHVNGSRSRGSLSIRLSSLDLISQQAGLSLHIQLLAAGIHVILEKSGRSLEDCELVVSLQ